MKVMKTSMRLTVSRKVRVRNPSGDRRRQPRTTRENVRMNLHKTRSVRVRMKPIRLAINRRMTVRIP